MTKGNPIAVLALALLMLGRAAVAQDEDTNASVAERPDRGDRIERRLDRQGDSVDRHMDRAARRAGEAGRDRVSRRLDRQGDRIDRRMDRRGHQIDRRMDRRDARRDRAAI